MRIRPNGALNGWDEQHSSLRTSPNERLAFCGRLARPHEWSVQIFETNPAHPGEARIAFSRWAAGRAAKVHGETFAGRRRIRLMRAASRHEESSCGRMRSSALPVVGIAFSTGKGGWEGGSA